MVCSFLWAIALKMPIVDTNSAQIQCHTGANQSFPDSAIILS